MYRAWGAAAAGLLELASSWVALSVAVERQNLLVALQTKVALDACVCIAGLAVGKLGL
jgi:hypothetical protein